MTTYHTIRTVFEIGGELQRGLQDHRVEHSDGNCGYVHTALPHASFLLHTTRRPLLYHHGCNAGWG